MITCVVFEMMFVLGYKRAVRTSQQFLSFDMSAGVFPEFRFRYGHVSAFGMFTFVRFQFTRRLIDPR